MNWPFFLQLLFDSWSSSTKNEEEFGRSDLYGRPAPAVYPVYSVVYSVDSVVDYAVDGPDGMNCLMG